MSFFTVHSRGFEGLLERLRSTPREDPRTDRDGVEEAMQRHFAALGIGPFPIRWVGDVETGCREVFALARKESRKLRWKRFVTALWAAVADGWPAGEGTPESVRKWESELGSLAGFVTLMNPEYVAACVAAGLRAYAAQRGSQGGSGGACRVVLEAAQSAALHKKWGWRVFDPSEDVQRCLYAGYVLVAAVKAAFQWTSSAIVPSNGLEAPPGWWRAWLGPEWAARRAAWHAALESRRRDWVRETLLPVWDPTWCLWPAFLSKAGSGGKGPAFDAYRAVWGALMEAAVAGLWSCWVLEREMLAAPRPSLRISGGRVHCADGPAISWPGGAALWMRRGVVEAPDREGMARR